MQFVNQLFENSQSNFDPLNFIGMLITVIASLYIFKGEKNFTFIKERHDNLVFPLFDALEPVLYQDPQQEFFKNAMHIVEKNKNLADGKLLELIYLCSINLSKENFCKLCSYIDKAYDRSCRKLGLKTRSITYRIGRNQYKSILFFLPYAIGLSLLSFFIAMVLFVVFLYVIAILKALYDTATPEKKLLLLTILCILTIALMKFAEKHI